MLKKYFFASKEILKFIKKSKTILVNVHRSPDLDSLGCALAFKKAIESKFKKKVVIVCPSTISLKYKFLPLVEKIKSPVDFSRFDFSQFDLFIILDSSSLDMVFDQSLVDLPKIPIVVIDHHQKNNIVADFKLVDKKASAVGEILFFLFKNWKIKINKDIATFLFASIYSDTVELKYCRRPKVVFAQVKELVEKGAKIDLLVKNFYQRYSIFDLKIIEEFIKNLKLENQEKIVWTAVDFQTYKKWQYPIDGKEFFIDNLLQNLKEAKLGILFLEEKKGLVRVSFRSKGEIDVSKLAEKFGGGGHKTAAGCTVLGDFKKKVEEILKKTKLYFQKIF